jgi:hypothetical protein
MSVLLNNPDFWEEFYKSYDIIKLSNNCSRILVEPRDLPQVYNGLKGRIDHFWGKFQEENPCSRNEPKYVSYGPMDLDFSPGDSIVFHPMVGHYSILMFKRNTNLNELTPEEQFFLRDFVCQVQQEF